MQRELLLRTIPNFYSPISIIITANLLILNRRLLPHSEAAAKTLHLSKLLLNKICPQVISNSVSILLNSNSCHLVCLSVCEILCVFIGRQR